MRECDLGFSHEDPEPEPVVIDDGTAEAAEAVSQGDVERARIEADAAVKIAKIEHRAIDEDLVRRIAALEAEAEVFRASMAPAAPAEPEVVAVDAGPPPE